MKLMNLFTIFIIILLVVLPSISQKIFTYEETPNEDLGRPLIEGIHQYNDNTIVVHIVRLNLSAPYSDDMICFDRHLSLRIIFPDGSVTPLDIPLETLDIPYLNFCIFLRNAKLAKP